MNEWIIRQVKNGYIVERSPDPSMMPLSMSSPRQQRDLHVFRTFGAAAAWIKRQMEPVA